MTKAAKRHTVDNGAPIAKAGLIQFRADEDLIRDLTATAERLSTPVGSLARLWVTQRLAQEQSYDMNMLNNWCEHRCASIEGYELKDFDAQPLLFLHLLPFQRWLDIKPELMAKYVGLLAPVERVSSFDHRINLDGFRTSKRFANDSTIAGYVQVFEGGQLESVREIPIDEFKTIYADQLDEDFVVAVWTYGAALEHMGVKAPVAIFVKFQNMAGYTIRSAKRSGASELINYKEFEYRKIIINSWEQLSSIESTAQLVKPILDKFANSAGLPRSASYSSSGHWLGINGLRNRREEKGMQPQIEKAEDKINISGTNRDNRRVELYLNADKNGPDTLIGKVRQPFVEPSKVSKVACFVLQNEMDEGALKLLYQLRDSRRAVQIKAGDFWYKGVITHLTESEAGGAWDGKNPVSEPTLMIDLAPIQRAQTPGVCANCGKATNGVEKNNPRRGTLCLNCFENNVK